jgi:hypothetical protein
MFEVAAFLRCASLWSTDRWRRFVLGLVNLGDCAGSWCCSADRKKPGG